MPNSNIRDVMLRIGSDRDIVFCVCNKELMALSWGREYCGGRKCAGREGSRCRDLGDKEGRQERDG